MLVYLYYSHGYVVMWSCVYWGPTSLLFFKKGGYSLSQLFHSFFKIIVSVPLDYALHSANKSAPEHSIPVPVYLSSVSALLIELNVILLWLPGYWPFTSAHSVLVLVV